MNESSSDSPGHPPPDPEAHGVRSMPSFEGKPEDDIDPALLGKRICDFDLKIEGRPLEQVIHRFRAELVECGIVKLQPAFYLTDEWGVPEGTVAIGMPFYLADQELLAVHRKKRAGLVEGGSESDLLMYLRHEMGHVVNYAYRLYATEEWTRLFGSMSRPYAEEYKVVPFSPDYVRHLPGGYAQKHPDEDWAESFAVWMTPRMDWRDLYQDSPGALAKLTYCAQTMARLRDIQPEVTSTEIDYDTREIKATVQEFYEAIDLGETRIPRSLDGDLQLIFPKLAENQKTGDASQLLKRHGEYLANSVYRWTGVDPSLIHPLVWHLTQRAKSLELRYLMNERDEALVALSGFLTALAMNYQYKGKFIAS